MVQQNHREKIKEMKMVRKSFVERVIDAILYATGRLLNQLR